MTDEQAYQLALKLFKAGRDGLPSPVNTPKEQAVYESGRKYSA